MLLAVIAERGWSPPIRYAISDRKTRPDLTPERYLARLFARDAHLIQWREKDLDPLQSRLHIRLGVSLAEATGKLFLVNSFAAEAARLGADGVHLTSRQNAAEALELRRRRRTRPFLIGRSVHTLEEARRAQSEGLDYLFVSPVRKPLSKRAAGPELGWAGLRRFTSSLGIPVFALGGMKPEHQAQAGQAGAVGIAGIGWASRPSQ